MESVGVEMQILRLKHQIGRRLVGGGGGGALKGEGGLWKRSYQIGGQLEGFHHRSLYQGCNEKISILCLVINQSQARGLLRTCFLFLWGGPNLFCIIHPREVGCSETMYQYLARVCPICIIFVFNLLLPPAAILGGCLVRNISFFPT